MASDSLQNTNEPDNTPESHWEEIKAANEMLKAQLMNTSLINELTRVLHSCNSLESIIKTVLLGMQEILGFSRVILFKIDKENFSLTPSSWVGIEEGLIPRMNLPLGFEGGEVTDAVFLNRHILVEQVDSQIDSFGSVLNATSYLVMPLVSKISRKCFEVKNCTITSCPAHGGYNLCCWSIGGSGQMLNTLTEDDKRRQCVKCVCFKCDGVFWMDKVPDSSKVTSDDITMLSTIINVAGLMIENFRMFNELEGANKELQQTNGRLKIVNHDLQIAQSRINADLDHARKIQQGLLPQGIADTPSFSLGAQYIPVSAVGGDYYDVFEVAPGVYGIIVADVSGHGISSALIMSMVKILLKSFASQELSPQKTLEAINQTFLSEIKTDNFVTIFYAVLDTTTHSIAYTSAGHCPVIQVDRQNKKCTIIKADGLFLGVFDDMMLNQAVHTYTPGSSRLVLFTDGLIECRNKAEEMFDLSRVEKLSIETAELSPKKTVDVIMSTQKNFCGAGQEPEDDITLLVIDF